MNKPKRNLPSVFWTTLADRLRLSRPFKLYLEMDAARALNNLRRFESQTPYLRRYVVEFESEENSTKFQLIVYRVSRDGFVLDSWAVGQIQDIENMEQVSIQGKVYPKIRELLIGIIMLLILSPFLLNWDRSAPLYFGLIPPLLFLLGLIAIVGAWWEGRKSRDNFLAEIERLFQL